ncbi:MFS transporter [Sphingobium estronivorans]|uniref:MFS transporter n=1 Tax=Sphingobium estronivorans TaxID=1577690 RepID=UPI001239B49D|nr:MFS transporter [Sphingobium estronivorans]
MTEASVPRSDGLIDAGRVIDEAPLGGFQFRILAIITAVMVLEGVDIQCISFVAPAIIRDWGIAPAAFGIVFSAGLIGALAGAALFGPLGDRFGRKPVILLDIVLFTIGVVATPFAWDVTSLAIIRFLTSVGLGGVTPNAIALIAEYAPARVRALLVAIVATSPLAGGMIGGIASRWVIPAFGWEWVFYGAGILSLMVLIPAMLLPESVRYLIAKGRTGSETAALVARLDPAGPYDDNSRFLGAQKAARPGNVADLFRSGFGPITLLLWLGVASNLFMTVLLIYWLPLLLEAQGIPTGTAIIATSWLNGAGIVGGVALAYLVDRIGAPRVLVTSSIIASLAVPLIGVAAPNAGLAILFVVLSGFFGLGAYAGLNIIAASVYPVHIRAAGVGFAASIGKAGAAAGPFAAGTVLAYDLPMTSIYVLAGCAGLVSTLTIVAIARWRHDPGEG